MPNIARLLLVLVLSSTGVADLRASDHVWSRRLGGSGDQEMEGTVAVDAAGNVYVAGSFEGSIDLGGGPLASSGRYDAFLAKFDGDGVHRWSLALGGGSNDTGRGLAVSATGDVYVTGSYGGVATIGDDVVESTGRTDVFLAKFDTTGAFAWSRSFGDSIGFDYGEAVAIDDAGAVHLAGRFQGVVDFGTGPVESAGLWDLFVVKMDADGVAVWSRRFGSTAHDYLHDADVLEGDVFITGHIYDPVDFGGGALPVAAGENVYLVRLDGSDGAHQWSRGLGGSGAQHAFSVDARGGVVALVGEYLGATDLGGGPLPAPFGYQMFVASYDASNGDHRWSHGFDAAGTDAGKDVVIDGSDRVVVAARIAGDIDFGGGTLPAIGSDDACLVTFDAEGAHIESARWGGTSSDEGVGVTVDVSNDVIFATMFHGTADFGGEPLTSLGDTDLALAKYERTTVTAIAAPRVSTPDMTIRPNPFNPTTMIRFEVDARASVRLQVFDVAGRVVRTLVDTELATGLHDVSWDGRDDAGSSVSSGTYFCRLRVDSSTTTRKMSLVE